MIKTKLELCKKCHGLGYVSVCDEKSVRSKTCEDCHGIGCIRVPQTNSDRIRAMSDEELANFFADKCLQANYLHLTDARYNLTATEIEEQKQTAFCILMKWLKQPAEETT